MNETIVSPEFSLDNAYKNMFVVVLVSVFYSPMMPLMLLFGGAALIVQYYTYKCYFLKLTRKPVNMDQKIHVNMIQLLPIACVLNLGIALWAYGTTEIFPYDMVDV